MVRPALGVLSRSENTRDPTPPINLVQDEEHVEQGDTQEHLVFSDGLGRSRGLRDDLVFFSYRACKELVSHLATLAKYKILSSLTNCEVVRRTYQSLGWSIRSQSELLKRHEQLNRDHVELYNRSEVKWGS
ncbi:hypothetical protein Tco_0153601 [Tanacetum coccineum]